MCEPKERREKGKQKINCIIDDMTKCDLLPENILVDNNGKTRLRKFFYTLYTFVRISVFSLWRKISENLQQ